MDDRRDDWRHGVDENLASLNAGQRVWEHELTTIRHLLSDIDKLLRGDPEKDTDGLVGRLHNQETEMRRMNAILFRDATGKGGLVEDVKTLKDGREDRRNNIGNITKIIVAIITSGAIGLFWHNIEAFFRPDIVGQAIARSKHPKKVHHVEIQEDPEPSVPEGQD